MDIKPGDNVNVNFPGSQDGSSKPINETGTVCTVGRHLVTVELKNGEKKLLHHVWVTKNN